MSLGAVYGIIAPTDATNRGRSETATATSPPRTRPVPTTLPTPVRLGPHSLTDPSSPWFLVNKLRPIPGAATYTPSDLTTLPAEIPNPNDQTLRQAAAAAFVQLAAAVKAETGATLVAQSGYRSFKYQTGVYASYTKLYGGAANADATSARPGYSEHQTGMAVDILDTQSGCGLEDECFGQSPTGVWLAANAYRFGWILRYPPNKSAVTGFAYEPWHFRWVGTSLASQLHDSRKQTLEEFFGLPPAPTYASSSQAITR
ncbi:M15 family metallopeptidase [Leifsonia shinshuensis]|uniref:M15 family metallopeptidase n=1 Tax=Leifsonia shinshuensis TaxID=150026 RepID=UPI001F50FD93|nr:M15 family metallopeptidase [Leifsonia shinshuensis]